MKKHFGRISQQLSFDRVDEDEKKEILKTIGQVLEQMPTGGNYQVK